MLLIYEINLRTENSFYIINTFGLYSEIFEWNFISFVKISPVMY